MNDYDVDEFECETLLLAKTPEARQHFFLFLWFPGFIGCVNRWQVFFKKFFRHGFETRSVSPLARYEARLYFLGR
jgi:hypothetical protein